MHGDCVGHVGTIGRADALEAVDTSSLLLGAGCGHVIVVAQAVGCVVAIGTHVLGGRDCRSRRLCVLSSSPCAGCVATLWSLACIGWPRPPCHMQAVRAHHGPQHEQAVRACRCRHLWGAISKKTKER